MKKLKYLLKSSSFFLFLPAIALAGPQEDAAKEAADFVSKFNEIILFPTIGLLSAVAFLVFLWGCAQYFINSANETARQEGVKHITFGIIGLVVMLSAYSILTIATGTFGLDDQLRCADNPSDSGCDSAFTIPGGSGGGGTGGGGIPGGGTP